MPDSTIRTIIETPKNSRVKFKLAGSGTFKVDRILPPGLRFPFNFGFLPDTQAADGDPTDIILIFDEALFPGCEIDCLLLGVIEAEQTENGTKYRNDRLIAISPKDSGAPRSISELPKDYVPNIQRFFATYHGAEGNVFKVLRLCGTAEAWKLVERTKRESPKRSR